MPTCPSRSTGVYATHGAASGGSPSICMTDRAFPSGYNSDAKSRGTRDDVVRLRHVEPARAITTRSVELSPHRWQISNGTDHPICYLDTLMNTGSSRGDYAQKTGPGRRICGARGGHKTTKMCDFRRTGWGRGLRGGGQKKSGWGVSWTTSELSVSAPTSGRLQLTTRGNSARRRNQSGTFYSEIDRCRESQGWTTACK